VRLTRRWIHGRIRMAGGRIKGPPPLSQDDRERFFALLERRIISLTRRADESS
jgi:uncharacterized protein YaiI (UPF0178 family)